MGLNVADRYTFNGPFTNIAHLLDVSGVYVITLFVNGIHHVIDIGESANIQTRIANHDRKHQWNYHANGATVYASTYHCDEPTRMAIERELRAFFNPVCGVH